MKAGDKAIIFEDFLTCHKPEGKATLITRLASYDGPYYNLARWDVHFDGDDPGQTCEREILVQKD